MSTDDRRKIIVQTRQALHTLCKHKEGKERIESKKLKIRRSVVDKFFLRNHIDSLFRAWKKLGNRKCFTYGSVINTSNFSNPNSEPFKLQDLSWAYFATGNVAIDKKLLEKSGLFDNSFRLYGWEDLELGERLRNMGVKLIKCPRAIGYHWQSFV